MEKLNACNYQILTYVSNSTNLDRGLNITMNKLSTGTELIDQEMMLVWLYPK